MLRKKSILKNSPFGRTLFLEMGVFLLIIAIFTLSCVEPVATNSGDQKVIQKRLQIFLFSLFLS